MAIFPSDTAGKIESADDLAKVRQYLRKLNDDLTYMFNNLTPEDNYSASAPKLIYSVDENGEASFEISTGGIRMRVASDEYVKANVEILQDEISLKVTKGDVHTELSSELRLGAGYVELYSTGQLRIQTGNLTIDSDGNATFSGALSAASGTFSGALSGGTIAIGGTTLNPAFTVDQYGNLTIGTHFAVDQYGNMTASNGTFSGMITASSNSQMQDYGLSAGSNFWVNYYGSDYDIGTGMFQFVIDSPHGDVFESNNGHGTSYSDCFIVRYSDGVVFCNDVRPYTNGARWQNGLAYYVDLLWEWYEEEHGGGGGGGGGGDEPEPEEPDGPVEP